VSRAEPPQNMYREPDGTDRSETDRVLLDRADKAEQAGDMRYAQLLRRMIGD
jgi:hypothetical protein